MNTEKLDRDIAQKSAVIYLSITTALGLLFYLITGWIGTYTAVARIGGVVWISLLTLIVSMPVVTSSMKKKMKG